MCSCEGPSVSSCQLNEIPGYLPMLRGCVARKISDNLLHWKENRRELCAAAGDVVRKCSAADAAYRAGGPGLPSDPSDPCCPRPHVLLETTLDCRDAFAQLQYLLLVEEDDFSNSSQEEVTNILEDLKEVQDILQGCQERLEVCRPVLDAEADDVTRGSSR
ncbi:uncharacterized protein LOC122381808 isoform X1 [Amphibalanus amphitrite]|uniref:uncharacterized protein LOC122381808 isoform X1 n=1 Tax=Amphibalanus amphitrite TaxID=1232801 RepID=UPI001C8FF300|nr:uncharacterized protein LOC122381808 isoform X1 [Amphibalanus amphitrite]